RRRVSQPSIHFPRLVYLPSTKTALPGLSRFSFGAKNSSLAERTFPPILSDARSGNSERTEEFSVVIDFLTSKKRRLHLSKKPPALIGRQLVAVEDARGLDGEARVRIDDDQISVKIWRDSALSSEQAGEGGRSARHPARKVIQSDAAAASLGPNHRQAELQRRNASPGLSKIARLERL